MMLPCLIVSEHFAVIDTIFSMAIVAFSPTPRDRTPPAQWYESSASGPDYGSDLAPAVGIFLSILLGLGGWAAILLPFFL